MIEKLSLMWADKLTGRGKDALRSKVSFKIPDRYQQALNPRSQQSAKSRRS